MSSSTSLLGERMSNTRFYFIFRFLSVVCYQLQELLKYVSEIAKLKEYFVYEL